ncbi:hypothetical protein [Nitriliruptor alkaliphilus]|uniref:hypothetical protein n=1 Tax=Nitriliruptor alkaliphilus TaxID=427918 RepID=UPI0012EEB1A6|nr:hypothetical protein [Nitriliruptor alkaliphilus]
MRVLIEHPDPATQDLLATGLRAHGYAVLTCGGPRSTDGTELSCPLLRHAPCGGVSGADAVLSCFDWSAPEERLILRRMAGEVPRPAIVLGPISRASAEHLADVVIEGLVSAASISQVTEALAALDLRPSRRETT